MFKITYLNMVSTEGKTYTYNFDSGINYFIGSNSTGKTKFFEFIDYMFGRHSDISTDPIYQNLDYAEMTIVYNNSEWILRRTKQPDANYLCNGDEKIDETDSLTLIQYTIRLNKIFTIDEQLLKDLREFSDENISYRTFTMFNFLDETSQGKVQDFLTKCTDIEYATKLNFILNFIFNKNLPEIKQKEKELQNLLKELSGLESAKTRFNFILNKVNHNLNILDANIVFTGNNKKKIQETLENIKLMQNERPSSISKKDNTVSELEVKYNTISEQIKVFYNEKQDFSSMKSSNEIREDLLINLNRLIKNFPNLDYLVQPINQLISEIDDGISFSTYITNDKTVTKFEKQLLEIKQQINNNDSRFTLYSLEAKEKALAIVEDCLNTDLEGFDEDKITALQNTIKELKKEIKSLQNSDDTNEIELFSNYVTFLYSKGKESSDFIENDFSKPGFKINYFKKGNILQSFIQNTDETDETTNNVYITGSMARHTLIQVCGYFAFLQKLLSTVKYPIIPILVIDHISKAFDPKNKKAIGEIIRNAQNDIGEGNLQIFMFDTSTPEELGVKANKIENLVISNKSGFCPFFSKNE